MATLSIVIGNKNHSSWSLRGWLPLKQTGANFNEIVVPLRQADSKQKILAHSPSGLVPLLKADGDAVWDSLAIGEYLAERFPEAGLWPAEGAARAVARSVSAEMHSGFAALRRHMPMDISRRFPGQGMAPGVMEDIGRVTALWKDCRERFGAGGDFLFGAFSIADASYAPVVTRLVTYRVSVDPATAAYLDAVMAWPAMREWIAAAEQETPLPADAL
jgi:glutathione S-transferase